MNKNSTNSVDPQISSRKYSLSATDSHKMEANLEAKAPKHIILDCDDTNANTYGGQQLTLFNDYYGDYCYMPLLIFGS